MPRKTRHTKTHRTTTRKRTYKYAVGKGNMILSRHRTKKLALRAAKQKNAEYVIKLSKKRRKNVKKGSALFVPFKLNI